MRNKSKQNISKSASYFLRHKPNELDIVLDEKGYVSFKEFVEKLNKKLDLTMSINDYVELFNSESKKRYDFNIEKDYIRAFYGHSVNVSKESTTDLPNVLYHGTTREAYKLISQSGIKKMSRDKVHLSETKEMAMSVGKRRDNTPIILNIDTKLALREGVVFYKEPNGVFLCDFVPLNCIY